MSEKPDDEPEIDPEIDIAELDAYRGTFGDRVSLVVMAIACCAILIPLACLVVWLLGF